MSFLIIEAGRTERHYWRDLWRYRELFYFLAWRDILVRYKQTAIGIAWALIRPFLTMIVFTFVFGRVAKLPSSGNTPYPLLVFAGMLPWQFFATAMSEASNSLSTNSNLISKVYFPRLIVPSASVITSFVDFLVTMVLMALMMIWYHSWPDWRILALPFFIALTFAAAIGMGLWLCALNVQYRDVRFIVPFLVQIGIYASPVGWLSSEVPKHVSPSFYPVFCLNPMVGIIDGFRWTLLPGQPPVSGTALSLSIAITTFFCFTGVWYFRRTEKKFADLL